MSYQDDIIRASEIAHYAFCARAWWLNRVKGFQSANRAAIRRGRARHRTHGRTVEGYHRLRRWASTLLILGGIALVVWLLLSMAR
jgi:hypothetical protein